MNEIQRALLDWYGLHGRAALPWRVVRDPYYTVVSETMLAQTQVDRVAPKFQAFVSAFPTFAALASRSTADVLRLWEGLGYNSRAVRLHRLAKIVVERFEGRLPHEPADLRLLPGVGPYTVSAIRAFGFNLDDAPVDTNVRRIVHRIFHGIEYPVSISARELDQRARELVPPGKGHDWSSAMMDLGAAICTARAPRCLVCPLRDGCVAAPIDSTALERLRKAHAKAPSPQEAIPFERTTRYARGRIVDRLRRLAPGRRISLLDLHRELEPSLAGRTLDDVRGLVDALARDGLVDSRGEDLALTE